MARFYTRAERRAYKEKRRTQATLVADRLMGKKNKIDPDVEDFFGGTKMRIPFQYSDNLHVSNPRTSFILSGIGGV
jgi:hypothetical protein